MVNILNCSSCVFYHISIIHLHELRCQRGKHLLNYLFSVVQYYWIYSDHEYGKYWVPFAQFVRIVKQYTDDLSVLIALRTIRFIQMVQESWTNTAHILSARIGVVVAMSTNKRFSKNIEKCSIPARYARSEQSQARREGSNSARLFTPEERKALGEV
jgi:hypothetical protein